jgi:hypothetical protein
MDSEWILVPNESWREETAPYRSRLETAASVDPAAIDAMTAYWPGVLWPNGVPPPQVSVVSRLGIYAVNLFGTALQVRRVVRDQWLSGLFVVVPLSTRFVLETWGAIQFARLTFERLLREGNVDREEERTNRLTFGARFPVQLPWGGVTDEKSFNVLEFVRGLSDARVDAEELYNFLSEASHPNMLQHSYFQMAGPPISNWNNAAFKPRGHSLLSKTLEAFEASARGMDQDIVTILRDGTDFIRNATP